MILLVLSQNAVENSFYCVLYHLYYYCIRTTSPTGGGKKIPPYGFWLFFFKMEDSRHAQLLIYVVFHKESDFKFKISNSDAQRPKIKKNETRNIYKKTVF